MRKSRLKKTSRKNPHKRVQIIFRTISHEIIIYNLLILLEIWRKCMGIEPTYQLVTGTLVLKTRRPTRRLGTSIV